MEHRVTACKGSRELPGHLRDGLASNLSPFWPEKTLAHLLYNPIVCVSKFVLSFGDSGGVAEVTYRVPACSGKAKPRRE